MKGNPESKFLRHTLFALGVLFFGLAIVGFLLPLIPGTPFMLLAVGCFSRSSKRMHRWVLGLPGVGPALQSWERDGSISLRAKSVATITLTLATLYPLFFEGLPLALRCIAGGVCILVLVFLWTRPSGKRG